MTDKKKRENVDYALSGYTGGFYKGTPGHKPSILFKIASLDDEFKEVFEDYEVDETNSSTERVRKYYRRHPEKVKQYLRKTTKDRVARNRDRQKAIKKYGKSKMKNHDVHHPSGAQNGNWRLAKKDHGPDKKDKKSKKKSPAPTPSPTPTPTRKDRTPSTPTYSPPKPTPAPTITVGVVYWGATADGMCGFNVDPFWTTPECGTSLSKGCKLYTDSELTQEYSTDGYVIQSPGALEYWDYSDGVIQGGSHSCNTSIDLGNESIITESINKEIVHRIKTLLTKVFKDPVTGERISVRQALKTKRGSKTRVTALRLLRKTLVGEFEKGDDKQDVEELGKYLYTRDYTKFELDKISDEYINNSDIKQKFQGLASSEDEFKYELTNSIVDVLSIKELRILHNSTVPEVLQSDAPENILRTMKTDIDNEVQRVLQAVKDKDRLPMPIIIKTSDGIVLFDGDVKLSALASVGLTMPVRVLLHDKNQPKKQKKNRSSEKSSKKKRKKKDSELLKRILSMKITNPETGNMIKIDTAMDYDKTHPAHQLALHMIRHYMAGVSTRAGKPKTKTYD